MVTVLSPLLSPRDDTMQVCIQPCTQPFGGDTYKSGTGCWVCSLLREGVENSLCLGHFPGSLMGVRIKDLWMEIPVWLSYIALMHPKYHI